MFVKCVWENMIFEQVNAVNGSAIILIYTSRGKISLSDK